MVSWIEFYLCFKKYLKNSINPSFLSKLDSKTKRKWATIQELQPAEIHGVVSVRNASVLCEIVNFKNRNVFDFLLIVVQNY